MIRINLLPTKEKAEAASQRQEISLFVLGLLLVLAVILLLEFSHYSSLAALEEESEALQQTIAALDVKVKDVADLEKKRKDLDAKLQVIADLGRKRVGPALVLRELATSIPDRAWLTEFAEVGGGATLTGQAIDNQTIAKFLRDLSTSPYFKNVDLVETTASDVGAVRLRKFILKSNINYAATVKAGDTPTVKAGDTPAVKTGDASAGAGEAR